jgi:copper(I)-binding protein
MEMRALTAIDIPANTVIPLSPGGLHLMAKGVQPNLEAGESVDIVLKFASGQSAQIAMPLVVNPSLNAPSTGKANVGGHQH